MNRPDPRIPRTDGAPPGARPGSSAAHLSAPPPSAPDSARTPAPSGTGRTPSDLLRELIERDPLGLAERVGARLRERHLLLDPERVFQRAAARVAYFATVEPDSAPCTVDGASTTGPDPDFPPELWLGMRVDEAIGDCLSIDERGAHADARRGTCDAPDDHRLFADVLRAGAARARRASVHFHRCPARARRLLIEILMERRSLDDCLAAGLGPLERLRSDLTLALDAATGERARREDARGPQQRTEVRP